MIRLLMPPAYFARLAVLMFPSRTMSANGLALGVATQGSHPLGEMDDHTTLRMSSSGFDPRGGYWGIAQLAGSAAF